ncbi:hypothetical protein FHS85_003059 [Rhodoligotrophos appendicifer]|uniref:hypothetical protein n=1 Tax=Rhodoligotrophos appendicifer TaxID=987056 RepID=UPI0011855628|nr:hypothetical protein [Rhodoligotrophos appendicifer]
MRKTAAFVISLLALSGAAILPANSTVNAAEPVKASALKALFPGKFEGVWKGKQQVQIGADANGTLKGFADGKFDTGKWEIKGDKLCVSFAVWTKGERRCGEVYRSQGWYLGLVKKSGEANLKFRPK